MEEENSILKENDDTRGQKTPQRKGFKFFESWLVFYCLLFAFLILSFGQIELLKVVSGAGEVLPAGVTGPDSPVSGLAFVGMFLVCTQYPDLYFPLKDPKLISVARLEKARYGARDIEPWRDTPKRKTKNSKEFNTLVYGMTQRRECLGNIDRIYTAMERYYKEHNSPVPFCTYDAEGKPLHSWRVLLLPYLGYSELYNKLRLDEPWDSEWNSRYQQLAPVCYCCPACRVLPVESRVCNNACYSAVLSSNNEGEEHVGSTSNDGRRLIVVERKPEYNWMNPTQELTIDKLEEVLADLDNHSNHVDGSVWAIGAEDSYAVVAKPQEECSDQVAPDVLLNELK